MRKVIVFVNYTIDGYLCGPNGELDWMLPDPKMNVWFSDRMRQRVDTILAGRKGHEMLDGIFRHQAADPNSPAELVDFANWMVDTPKVVFSRTHSEVSGNATVATGDLAEAVTALKAAPGKDMVIFAGVETVQDLVRHGLVDEYWIKTYPIALGEGRPLFTDLSQAANLELVECQAHDSGIITQRYLAKA